MIQLHKYVKSLCGSAALTLTALISYGQSEPMYSQYMFNTLNVNPAYAGARGDTSVTGLFRNQWVGIKGAPQTAVVSADFLARGGRVGLGLQLMDDQIGVERTTGVMANYSFRIPVSDNGVLSLGLRGGIINYRANFLELTTFQPGDPVFMQNVNGVLPAAGAGVYYASDRFYAGLSAPSILATKLTTGRQADVSGQTLKNLHLFYMMGGVIDLSEQVKLKPSMLIKRVNAAPVQFDFNANVWLMDRIGIGASYRTGDALVGMLEWQVNDKFRFGYAYDYNTSDLRNFNQGTHELMIRYEIGSASSPFVSNRYF
ncbi:MAG: type IX secretion system membrane protein PorP/SprF [Sediminibacterium sp.]